MLEDKQGNITTSSFVQIRGSIPLLWSQIPNIKYKPPTRIAPPTDSHPAFDRHFKELLETYQVIHHNLLAFGHCHRYLTRCHHHHNVGNTAPVLVLIVPRHVSKPRTVSTVICPLSCVLLGYKQRPEACSSGAVCKVSAGLPCWQTRANACSCKHSVIAL